MIALRRIALAPSEGLLTRLLRAVREAFDPARARGCPRLELTDARDVGRVRWFGRVY